MQIIPVLAVLVFIAGCNNQAASTEPGSSISKEKLIAAPPQGWTLVQQMNNSKTRISDFVPEDQSDDEWQTRLSFQAHSAADLPFDPISLLMSEAQEDMNRCNFVQHFNVHSGYENNYETSVRLYLCGENAFSGKGEVKLIKAIRGEEFFYSIRFVKRVPPFDVNQPDFANEQIAAWSAYLSGILVCDDTEQHPCP